MRIPTLAEMATERNELLVRIAKLEAENAQLREELAVHKDVNEYQHRKWFEFHNPGKTLEVE